MKKRMREKIDFSIPSYLLGILSIILAFFNPGPAIVIGITGLVLGKRQETMLAKRGRKFSTIGIILAVVLLIVSIIFIKTILPGLDLGNY